jgi:hypothetical protein
MIINHKGNQVHFDSVNDVNYVLSQIPHEVSHRKATLKPLTKVLFTLDVDGVYTQHAPFKRETVENEAAVQKVSKILVGNDEHRFALNSVSLQQVFNVRITIRLEFDRLDQCDGQEIVVEIRKRLTALEKAGLKLREPQPEGPKDKDD